MPNPDPNGILYNGGCSVIASPDFASTGSCYPIPNAGKWGFQSDVYSGPLNGEPERIDAYYTVYAGPNCQGTPLDDTSTNKDCVEYDLPKEASYYICRTAECKPKA